MSAHQCFIIPIPREENIYIHETFSAWSVIKFDSVEWFVERSLSFVTYFIRCMIALHANIGQKSAMEFTYGLRQW